MCRVPKLFRTRFGPDPVLRDKVEPEESPLDSPSKTAPRCFMWVIG